MSRPGWLIVGALVLVAILWYAAGPAAVNPANSIGGATRVRRPVGDSGGYTEVEVSGVQIGDFSVGSLGLKI